MRKILFIKVNPIGTKNLFLDTEEKELMDTRVKSEHRDHYQITSKGAVSIDELHQYLEAYKPDILHISGHGSADGKLYFHDAENHKKEVSLDKFCTFIKNYDSHLKCIFLNACFSINGIAQALVSEGQTIIGMQDEVPNDTAILFSKSFYTSLFAGKTIKEAFDTALGVVGIDGFGDERIPVQLGKGVLKPLLIPNEDLDDVIPRTLTELVSEANFELAKEKRLRQKRSYYGIVAIIVLCTAALAVYSFMTQENTLYSLAAILPLGLIKWVKNKLDGIDDTLMLLKMLETEIDEFIESLKTPPVERVHERTAQYNDQFWKILEVNR